MERLKVPDEIAVRVPEATMRRAVCDIFAAMGLPEDDAGRAADVLIWADLRGVDSHGASNMMPLYVRWLREGVINPHPEVTTVREAPATGTLDSDRGLGLVLGPDAMALAIEKARACGIGSVVMTNGRHFGAAGYHAALALEHGMIGMAMTVGGLAVAPTHGSKAMVGLNPLAVAVPAGEEPPFLFDASMSSVAGNKIRIAQRLGVPVGPGWIAEPDGTPVLEPGPVPESFLMLPLGATRDIGSHKGYSLAMMVDVLCGMLAGTGPGFRAGENVSHHFLALNVEAFTDAAEFREGMDVYLRALRETPPAPREERVTYAGLHAYETEQERRRNGIPYHPEVIGWYRDTARELGLADQLAAHA